MLPTSAAASLAKVARAEQKAKEKRRNKLFGMHRHTEPLDRGIYQVKGARPVSGGLPSLGRGH